MFKTIRNKLLLFGLSISLIPIILITFLYYFHAGKVLKHHQLNELSSIAESRKLHILTFIEAKKWRTTDFSSDGFIRKQLEAIFFAEDEKKDDVTVLNNYLTTQKKSLDTHIAAISIARPDGKIIASTNENMINLELSTNHDFVLFKNHLSKDAFVEHPLYVPGIDINCIPMMVAIPSKKEGEILGILTNYYLLDSLSETTSSRVGMGDSGEILLGVMVRDNITFLTALRYRTEPPLNVRVPVESGEARPMKLALEGKSGTLIAHDYRGVDVVAAYEYIPSLQWGLVAKIDKSEVYAPLSTLGIVALITGGVSAAIAISVGAFFAHSVSRPINTFKITTEKFASGELNRRVSILNKDEIGKLAMSFNTMAENLSHEIAIRRQNEMQLRKLSFAVEQSPNSVVITDPKGNVEYVNPSFYKITGYSYNEVIGKNPRILKSGETSSEEYKQLWETIMSGRKWQGEFHNKRKDGSLLWEYAIISPIRNEEGVISHFVGVKEDITERKQAEEIRVRQKQEREVSSLNQSSDFLLSDVKNKVRYSQSMSENGVDLFEEFVGIYVNLLDLAIKEQVYKVEHRLSEHLRSFAERLGSAGAGPDDVAQIHSTAMKRKCKDVLSSKLQAYTEEGRFVIIELMGCLVSYYRRKSNRG
ncbi:MAG: PAS domain S-box protein [Candidatus Kuenenia sp.]|nr:PAS domain S-box protein [Candidatus Kuenenia hertensis]